MIGFKPALVGLVALIAVKPFLIDPLFQDKTPGVVAPNDPYQQPIKSTDVDSAIIPMGEYQIRPLARFSLDARVLSVEGYFMDKGSDVSPVDFALGWGRMSDLSILDSFYIRQGGRFFYWVTSEFPIPRKEVETHASNMHIIPADERVAKMLRLIDRRDIIHLDGYLVEVRSIDGFRWSSSLTRGDTGNGACEIVLVKNIYIKKS